MLKLNNQEKDFFIRLSKGPDSKVFKGYCSKIVNELIDIRNIPDEHTDIEKKARTLAVKMIESSFISKLSSNNDFDGEDNDEFE